MMMKRSADKRQKQQNSQGRNRKERERLRGRRTRRSPTRVSQLVNILHLSRVFVISNRPCGSPVGIRGTRGLFTL